MIETRRLKNDATFFEIIITNFRYKSLRYIEVFLWEFDRHLTGVHYYQVYVI